MILHHCLSKCYFEVGILRDQEAPLMPPIPALVRRISMLILLRHLVVYWNIKFPQWRESLRLLSVDSCCTMTGSTVV